MNHAEPTPALKHAVDTLHALISRFPWCYQIYGTKTGRIEVWVREPKKLGSRWRGFRVRTRYEPERVARIEKAWAAHMAGKTISLDEFCRRVEARRKPLETTR